MPKELMMIRNNFGLVPAADVDREILSAVRSGQAVKVEIKNQSARSVQHHRLFFALLKLTLDYWQPKTSMLTNTEIQALKRFIEWTEKETGERGALRELGRVYLRELDQSRKRKIETPPRSIDALLEWVKRAVGHIEYIQTPSGLIVQTKSINFNSMSQQEFDQFYKEAFSVCWREVMKAHFESESEMQKVVEQMALMG